MVLRENKADWWTMTLSLLSSIETGMGILLVVPMYLQLRRFSAQFKSVPPLSPRLRETVPMRCRTRLDPQGRMGDLASLTVLRGDENTRFGSLAPFLFFLFPFHRLSLSVLSILSNIMSDCQTHDHRFYEDLLADSDQEVADTDSSAVRRRVNFILANLFQAPPQFSTHSVTSHCRLLKNLAAAHWKRLMETRQEASGNRREASFAQSICEVLDILIEDIHEQNWGQFVSAGVKSLHERSLNFCLSFSDDRRKRTSRQTCKPPHYLQSCAVLLKSLRLLPVSSIHDLLLHLLVPNSTLPLPTLPFQVLPLPETLSNKPPDLQIRNRPDNFTRRAISMNSFAV